MCRSYETRVKKQKSRESCVACEDTFRELRTRKRFGTVKRTIYTILIPLQLGNSIAQTLLLVRKRSSSASGSTYSIVSSILSRARAPQTTPLAHRRTSGRTNRRTNERPQRNPTLISRLHIPSLREISSESEKQQSPPPHSACPPFCAPACPLLKYTVSPLHHHQPSPTTNHYS
ncbi:hypothetical protein BDD12DRAFT_266025 [Trichophaea hybrida]|nr:hypothetical protein BDD12DRAFT_266025 [Trichophaea hybrida]